MQLLGSVWWNSNEYRRVKICLHGSGEVRLQINRRFFAAVQKYIIDTNRFSIPNVWPNVFILILVSVYVPQVRVPDKQNAFDSNLQFSCKYFFSFFVIKYLYINTLKYWSCFETPYSYPADDSDVIIVNNFLI